MKAPLQFASPPRKTPVQARSAVTVDAIHEAAIQVLLDQGAERFTTIRVAERAGVSVGTLYQYYSNKQSLLLAVLDLHLSQVAEAVEQVCRSSRGKSVGDIAAALSNAFLDAKLRRADISVALYRIASNVEGISLVERVGKRMQRAVGAMLRTSVEGSSPELVFAGGVFLTAMGGATRRLLEAGAPSGMEQKLRRHLEALGRSYLTAVARRDILLAGR